ncbi:MAG: hypothetical protein A3I05_05965 [Deltaproteobacteria bacterium RIFCSPLOWO2_02_FULL_44_10]|nr:MAG: hypothetical protein A3C46_04785 [Deltaproteobacteria bacterium RIFCSPHIGHO2_02_FULL_44_16]OGQ46149.1 MAG: hypothetical protein A3I05_05965 [Deltaproteobacteria bacterium RIFCSPLOWO2_02_FULL_44_10]
MTLPAQKQESSLYHVGIQYRIASTIFQAATRDATLRLGERVSSGEGRNMQLATIITTPTEHSPQDTNLPTVRRATAQEIEHENVRREQALLHFNTCKEKIKERALPMKLTDAEITEGESKIIFTFSAEDRVDFRSFVKELSNLLRLRVEMRHIGSRDEAKYRGCLGACGQVTTCCSTFLRQFRSISIGMAKVQGLAPNPQKLTGLCGKLKCCLSYESELYAESRKGLLKLGNVVHSPKGVGRIFSIDILRHVYSIKLDEGGVERFRVDECTKLSHTEVTERDERFEQKHKGERERTDESRKHSEMKQSLIRSARERQKVQDRIESSTSSNTPAEKSRRHRGRRHAPQKS